MAPQDKSYSSRGQGFMFRVIFLVLVVLGLKEVVCNLQEGSDQGDIIRGNKNDYFQLGSYTVGRQHIQMGRRIYRKVTYRARLPSLKRIGKYRLAIVLEYKSVFLEPILLALLYRTLGMIIVERETRSQIFIIFV